MKKRRRRLLILLIIMVLLVGCWWFNTFTLTQNVISIADDKIKGAVTIVQITDLHGASFGQNNQQLIDKIAEAQPDLIAVTGDMYSAGDNAGQATALALLAALADEYPVYYVNGEHDNDEAFHQDLVANGVHVLNYQSEEIVVNETSLCLYGINNMYYSPTFDLANEFTLDPEKYNILLAHASNFAAFSDFGIDLSLCGDTHGGQIRLPFIGALNNRGVWFPEMTAADNGEAEYTKGLYSDEEHQLFISSGLGNYPLPFRLFNRPEIAVIHLVPVE